jgi:transcriptional regulator with XRE-family HTH domain
MLHYPQTMQDAETPQSALSSRPATFHLWVKRWRAYLGVTQKEFANLWGVSASMVQKIEAEDYSVGQLSFERLEDLRGLLKLSPSAFYSILGNDNSSETGEGNHVVNIMRVDENHTGEFLKLPRSLLGEQDVSKLVALELTGDVFATDKLRYSIPAQSLLILNTAPALPDDIVFAYADIGGKRCKVLLPLVQNVFLRPLDEEDHHAFELKVGVRLEVVGVYVAHWSSQLG